MLTTASNHAVPTVESPAVAGHAGSASARRYYRPEADCLRFVAFFLVLLVHVLPATAAAFAPWSGSPAVQLVLTRLAATSAFGLSIFFSLSAYLIATLLLRERESSGTISLRDFYIRRILRIWPLYFFALALGFLLTFAGRHAHSHMPLAFVAYLLLAGNWYSAYFGFPKGFIAPLWSISVEEQFYLMIPTAARAGGRRMLLWVAAVLAVLCVAALAVLKACHVTQNHSIWADSFVQFGTFAGGLVLAVYLDSRRPPDRPFATQMLLLLGSLVLFLSASLLFHVTDLVPAPFVNLALGYLCVSAASALLVFAFLVRRWQPARFLVYLGKISYGLYVYHLLLVSVARAVMYHGLPHVQKNSPAYSVGLLLIALPLTIAAAAASYRWLETPFLRMKQRFERVRSRPV